MDHSRTGNLELATATLFLQTNASPTAALLETLTADVQFEPSHKPRRSPFQLPLPDPDSCPGPSASFASLSLSFTACAPLTAAPTLQLSNGRELKNSAGKKGLVQGF